MLRVYCVLCRYVVNEKFSFNHGTVPYYWYREKVEIFSLFADTSSNSSDRQTRFCKRSSSGAISIRISKIFLKRKVSNSNFP
jgi:hypothetical protein